MESDGYLFLGILALLVLLCITLFAFAVYSGLFVEIEVKSCKPGFENLHVAYKFARGLYKESSEQFTEAHALAPDLHCIGIYYDDPRKTSPVGLRYIVGVIVNDGKTSADEATTERLKKEGYIFTTFPAVDYVVMTSFPFKGTLSVMIAIARVYPVMAEYIKEHKLCAHPFIEIYSEDSIHFVAPLAKQDEFYVKEANQVEASTTPVATPPSARKPQPDEFEEPQQKGEDEEPAQMVTRSKMAAKGEKKDDSDSTSSFEELNLENS